MNEAFIIAGGVYSVALIVFHLLFGRIFDWPATLRPSGSLNTAIMQVLNLSITFIFLMFAYVSFFHAGDLLNTPLGRSLLALISCLWLFRTVLQAVFFELRHRASVALACFFLLGAILYGVPVIT